MLRHKIILGMVVCLSTAALVSQTLSQTGAGYGAGGGFRRPPTSSAAPGAMPKPPKREVTDESRQASLRGAAGATDEQWTAIKPKLEKVWQLKQTTSIGIMIGAASGSGGGSSSSGSVSPGRSAIPPRPGVSGGGGGGANFGGKRGDGAISTTEPGGSVQVSWRWGTSWGRRPPEKQDEKLCAGLFNLLKDKNAKPEELKQKMDELRKAREQKTQELAEARKELRGLLTFDQEARMVALGWLD